MEATQAMETEPIPQSKAGPAARVDAFVSNSSRIDCEVRSLRTFDELETLRPFWNRVNRHPDDDLDFYSLFVSFRAEELKPYVLVASRDGSPIAMWIGRLERGQVQIKAGYRTLFAVGLRQINFLQDGFLGESSPAIAQKMVRHVLSDLKAGLADRAYVSNTDINLDIFGAARRTPGFALRDHAGRTAERWRTTLPASMDEFLKRRSKKHRYWLRRIGRVFDEAYPGQVQYKTFNGRADIKSFCEAAERVAANTYQRGLGVGFVNTSETHRRLELAADKGWLKAYAVFVKDEPVAFWCGRFYRDVMYLDWTGYKPTYRKYEVGTVLFLKMIEDLCKLGAREIDYGTGTAGYKERFGDHKYLEGMLSMYAPTMKGLTTNFLETLDRTVNGTAKTIARKLGVMNRIKKHWRGKLAGKAAEAADDATDTSGATAE